MYLFWHDRQLRVEERNLTSQIYARTNLPIHDPFTAFRKHQKQNKWYPKGVYLPISKLHSILPVSNLLAHNNLWLFLLWARKFGTAKIECSFEMGK